jgi:hypothetical protein
MMQVSKDTPDEFAALTKPLEPVAKRVAKKQLKEKVSAPRTHAMATGSPTTRIWGLHRLHEPLKFG